MSTADLISELSTKNAQRWKSAHLTRRSEYTSPVSRIEAAQNRYELIQAQTGVHWTFVACTHYRESDLNFARQLAQGDPLSQVSRNVPRGRGPFKTFEDGAYDALVVCSPQAAKNPLWKSPAIMPGMLTLLEMYNGLGYARKGIASPYVWSGTDQYHSGKYVSDGVFDPNTIDKQLGVAGLLVCLTEAQPALFQPKGTIPTPPIVKPLPEPQKPVEAPPAPVPHPEVPQGPIINKEGEDITDAIRHFIQLLETEAAQVWEWLRKH